MSRLDDAADRLRQGLPSPAAPEEIARRARARRVRRRFLAGGGITCLAAAAAVGVAILVVDRDSGSVSVVDPAEQPTAPAESVPTLPIEQTPDGGWDVFIDVDEGTGAVTAPGFNELIEETRPEWADLAREAAQVLLHVSEEQDDVEVVKDASVPERPVVTVTSTSDDDSIAAVRYELVFEYGDDGLARFVEGTWSQRCRPGRGHQDFAVAPCG